MIDPANHLDVVAAAKYLNITTTAVYSAISSRKIQAFRIAGKWYIDFKEVEGYASRRYDRRYSTFKGELKFDPQKGEMTPLDVAKNLRMPVQTIYYLLRTKKLKAFRKGSCYVVLLKDMDQAKKILNNNRQGMVRVISYDGTESDGHPDSMGSA